MLRFWIHVTRHLDTSTSEVARVSNLFNRNEKYQVSRLRAVSNSAGTKCGCFHVQEQSDLFNDDDDQVQLLWTGVFEDAVWLLCMRETKPSYSPMLTCLAYFALFWDPVGMFWVLTQQDSKFGSQELLNLNPCQFCDSTSANFADLDRPWEERTPNVGPTCLVFMQRFAGAVPRVSETSKV